MKSPAFSAAVRMAVPECIELLHLHQSKDWNLLEVSEALKKRAFCRLLRCMSKN